MIINESSIINEMNVAKPANGHIDFFLWQVLWPLGVPVEPAQPASEPPPLEQIEDGRDGGRRRYLHVQTRPSHETTRIRKDQTNMDDCRQPSTYFSPSRRAARCKTMQDRSRLQKYCKNLQESSHIFSIILLLDMLSSHSLHIALTKARLLLKQQSYSPRCAGSTIRTASWRLHATRST